MRSAWALLTFAAAAALVVPATASAGGPAMVVGATEDVVRQATLPQAKAQMDMLRVAGFTGVRLSQVWQPGETSLTEAALVPLQNAVDAARLDGMDVLITVTQFGSRTTPLTQEDQDDFAEFAAWLAKKLPYVRRFIVSNEPNLNRFWLPQYGPDGSDVAAPAYEALLAKTYDALKKVDPELEVLGGALAPRGSDRAGTIRDTHSPTMFITDMAAAYRASGRTKPIMDALAIHPYEDDSSVPPALGTHPNTTTIALADYDKLVALLRESFAGTAQPGGTLPIFYDEFGVESVIPSDRTELYRGTEPTTTKPVDEATQAGFYRQALALAFCQPNVEGISLFHAFDEPELLGWQSGLYYVNKKPKSSLAPVRASISDVTRGVIASCDGLHLRPQVTIAGNGVKPRLSCNIDCGFKAKLVQLPGTIVRRASGTVRGGTSTTLRFASNGLRPGRYQVRFEIRAVVNPAPKNTLKHGPIFRLP
jgi:hypothetical protein